MYITVCTLLLREFDEKGIYYNMTSNGIIIIAIRNLHTMCNMHICTRTPLHHHNGIYLEVLIILSHIIRRMRIRVGVDQ